MSGGFRDYRANARLYAAINRPLSQLPQAPLPPLFADPVSKPDVTGAANKTRAGLTGNQVAIIVAIVGLVGTLGAAFFTGMFGMLQNNQNSPTLAVLQPSTTSANAPPSVPTATLEIAHIVQTLDAQATIDRAARFVLETAAAEVT
jgi:hypothetical protein